MGAGAGSGWRLHRSLIAVTLAGVVLRFATLGSQSFWLDEAVSARLVRMGFGRMIRSIRDGESTPPLYYAVAWLWTRVFGGGEVGLRSLSALLGTAAIPVVWLAARRWLHDDRAALAAAALTAFSPLLVWYSQEGRSYALLVLLAAITLVGLPGALAGRRSGLMLWAAGSAGALATHYFAIFLVGPEVVWLLARRRTGAAPAVLVPVATAAALLPLALHQRDRGSARFIAGSALGHRVLEVPKQLLVGYASPGETVLVVLSAALALGLIAVGAGTLRARAGPLAALAAAALALPLLAALIGLDYLITRNVIAAFVPLALAAGVAATRRVGRVLVAGLCAVGLAAVIGVATDARFQRDNWRGAVRTLPGGRPVAIVVAPASGRIPLEYYLPHVRLYPAGGAAVRGLDLIVLGQRRSGDGVVRPRVAAAPAPPPGFGPPTVVRHATFVVVRYPTAGSSDVRVGPAQLAALDVIRRPVTLMLAG